MQPPQIRFKPAQLKDSGSYTQPARDGKYDLVIFDRCGPEREEDLPRSNTFFVGYPPPPWHFGGADDGFRVHPVQFPPVRGWSDVDLAVPPLHQAGRRLTSVLRGGASRRRRR